MRPRLVSHRAIHPGKHIEYKPEDVIGPELPARCSRRIRDAAGGMLGTARLTGQTVARYSPPCRFKLPGPRGRFVVGRGGPGRDCRKRQRCPTLPSWRIAPAEAGSHHRRAVERRCADHGTACQPLLTGSATVDDGMSFGPWHRLAAHRGRSEMAKALHRYYPYFVLEQCGSSLRTCCYQADYCRWLAEFGLAAWLHIRLGLRINLPPRNPLYRAASVSRRLQKAIRSP
jgi:hypothetical protein